jgi:surfactin family lipopeptide synthetase A
VPTEGSSISDGELSAHLRQHLPKYMIPSVFVALDAIPLTSNGKVDRQSLPEPDISRADSEKSHTAPRTELEKTLVEIWAALLMIESVGIYDNFFELGGHSLLAMLVISRIREDLQVELPLRRLFEEPTVAGLAADIEQIRRERACGDIAPINRVTAVKSEQLLENLDQLSDDQVNLLLADFAAINEVSQ